MLQLKHLAITQFKNYHLQQFSFTERVVGIHGLNGMGKTNLLDAIYYLCFTKSYFAKTDVLNTRFGTDGFRLEGNFTATAAVKEQLNHQITCIYRGVGKKEFLLNQVPYTKYSAHIGQFPCVMIAPDDVELITGGSEERRHLLDTVLSQLNPVYLEQLIVYNKVLLQRNSLLKQFAETGKTDWPLLEILDEQLTKPGNFIFQERKQFTSDLLPLVQQYYAQISGNAELIQLQYESQLLEQDFHSVLNQVRQKDFILQRTNGGIHKDDILLMLAGQPFKSIASQGQRKSLLFAIKLAEYSLIKQKKGFAPILLLDDIFEKLDAERMQNLLHWVCNENDGQVFITDTHQSRLEAAFTQLSTPYQLIGLTGII